MKRQALAVVVVLAAAGTALAAGQGVPEGRGRGGSGRGPCGPAPNLAGMKERLGLTDAQADELRALQKEQRKAQIRRRAEVEVAKIDLRSLLDTETPDEKAVAAQVKQLSELHTAGLKARVDGRLEMRKLLTPEQQRKLREMRPLRARGDRGLSLSGEALTGDEGE